MTARAVVPEGFEPYVAAWRMSPGLAAGGFLFLTGMTATEDGRVRPPSPASTAIEVAGFVTPGVIVELRTIARVPERPSP